MTFEILARTGAATVGGYLFCYAAAAAASRVLPLLRSEVVILTAFAAVPAMVAIAIWAFGCRSILRTWGVLIGGAIPLYVIGMWPL
ncbi:MAG TPA: hypothetical protein VNR18_00160 [Hyphomicrobiales bacterium]|nr:hypothetical protein [Hyphomicrobiales bacterium]